MIREQDEMSDTEAGVFIGKSQAICLIAEDQMRTNWHWAAEDLWSTLYGLLRAYAPKEDTLQCDLELERINMQFRDLVKTWMRRTGAIE